MNDVDAWAGLKPMGKAAMVLRNATRVTSSLLGFGVRSGRWWIVLCVVAVLVASLAAATTKTVPVVVYTLF